MRLYKLTNEKHQTYNKTQWGPGVTHTANGKGALCSGGWLHAYTSPELALLLNPMHADFQSPVLWEAEGRIGKRDYGLKVGCTELTTIRILSAPTITTKHRAAFAILCAKQVYKNPNFLEWADNWLSGKLSAAAESARATESARAAARAAEYARAAESARAVARAAARATESARAAAWSARAAESAWSEWSAWSAEVAARAAEAAARAAESARAAAAAAARAAESARAAAWSARAAAAAARAAAWSARAAESAARAASLDLDALAKHACGLFL